MKIKLNNKKITYLIIMCLSVLPVGLSFFLPLVNIDAAGGYSLNKILNDAATANTYAAWAAIVYMAISLITFVVATAGFAGLDSKTKKLVKVPVYSYALSFVTVVALLAVVLVTHRVIQTSEYFSGNVTFAYGFYIVLAVNVIGLAPLTKYYYSK